MKRIDEILKRIEELREEMSYMIKTRDCLLENDIIEVSRHLDEHLVEYYKLLRSKG